MKESPYMPASFLVFWRFYVGHLMQKDADDPLDKPQSVSSNVDFHVPILFHSHPMVYVT